MSDYENIQVLHLTLGNLAETGDKTMRRGSQLLFLDLLQGWCLIFQVKLQLIWNIIPARSWVQQSFSGSPRVWAQAQDVNCWGNAAQNLLNTAKVIAKYGV